MRKSEVGLFIAAIAALAAGCARREASPTGTGYHGPLPETAGLIAYVPCGMQAPLMEALDAFDQQTGIVSTGYYDNTMVLVRKIMDKGERPDIFLSPGGYEMRFLEEKGLVEPDSSVPIGSYSIVLVVPKGNPAGVKSLEDLARLEVKSIGLGDPDTNSIGYFTRQALRKLGLWEKVEGKVVRAEHPVESFEWVTSGKVQAAFSFNACPLESNPARLAKQNIERIEELPADSYDIPAVTVAVLKDAPHKEAAEKFVRFLREESTQRLLAENGLPNQRNLALGACPAKPAETTAAQAAAKEGKVVINAFYPANEDHKKIFDMVRKLEKKYAGQVVANCYDIRGNSIEDLRAYRESGLRCAGILINGQSTWMVKVDGKLTEAAFLKSPWVGGWTEQELEAAVAQAMAEALPAKEGAKQ